MLLAYFKVESIAIDFLLVIFAKNQRSATEFQRCGGGGGDDVDGDGCYGGGHGACDDVDGCFDGGSDDRASIKLR